MNNSKSLKRKARAEQQEKQGKKVITGIAIAYQHKTHSLLL